MGILYEYAIKDKGTEKETLDTDNNNCFKQDGNKPMSLSEMTAFISTSSIYSNVISDMVKSGFYYED